MAGSRDCGPRGPKMLAIVLATILLNSPISIVQGLRTSPGSPCEDKCNKFGPRTNTTTSEIACLDSQYNQTTKGQDFEDCITCELTSVYVDAPSGETDVNWGLYNLRFAFSTCVFGFPSVISNQSSQCPVACAGIQSAVETDLTDPSATNLRNWCSSTSFADNVVNTCEFCYNLTSNAVNPGSTGGQVYLANFLESIRYNCHFPTTVGFPFAVTPTRIFTQVLLPSSMSLTTPTAISSSVNLPVVIAVPILGFVIILVSVGICCFFFIRYRRKRARRERYQNHLYSRWNDTTIGTPKQSQGGWGWADNYGQYSDYDPATHGAAAAGYGYGPGFGFVDSDGNGRQVGYEYSKAGVQQEVTEARTESQNQQGVDPDKKQAMWCWRW